MVVLLLNRFLSLLSACGKVGAQRRVFILKCLCAKSSKWYNTLNFFFLGFPCIRLMSTLLKKGLTPHSFQNRPPYIDWHVCVLQNQQFLASHDGLLGFTLNHSEFFTKVVTTIHLVFDRRSYFTLEIFYKQVLCLLCSL